MQTVGGCGAGQTAARVARSSFAIEYNCTRNRERYLSAQPITPLIAGYAFDEAPDLADALERARLSASAIKAFVKIAEKWGLNETQARGLLGGIASSTYHAWRTEARGRKLDLDKLMRISILIGIYKALNVYFGKPWAERWVTLGNRGPLLGGRTPVDYMIRHGQPGMLQIRRMLDSWRGGR